MKLENKNIKKYEEELNKWKERSKEACSKYINSGLKRDYDYATWVQQYYDGMKKAYDLLLGVEEK